MRSKRRWEQLLPARLQIISKPVVEKETTKIRDAAEIVTETEADEILEKAREFQTLVEDWIADNYPAFKP